MNPTLWRVSALGLLVAAALSACGASPVQHTPTTPIPLRTQGFDASTLTFTNGEYELKLRSLSAGQYGLQLTSTASASVNISQDQPAQLIVKNGTAATELSAPYTSVTATNGALVARATLQTTAGSRFEFEDTYTEGASAGAFAFSRKVTVLAANTADQGFASRFTLGPTTSRTINDYRFFAPAVWYDKNANVAAGALASDYNKNYFYFRETRLALPFIMMQDADSGLALSIAHGGASPSTVSTSVNEGDEAWLVDRSIKYASVGAQKVPRPMLAVVYPANEGERTYVGYRDGWTRRAHPVSTNFSHAYQVLIKLDRQPNYRMALAQTWRHYYSIYNPTIANVPLSQVYQNGIDLFNTLAKDYPQNGAWGLLFKTDLAGNVQELTYQMGFVGQQIPAGYQLLRAGLKANDRAMATKGEAIVDFWANNSLTSSGLPRVWYEADTKQFRSWYPSYLRITSDGMEGALAAARLMRQQNQSKANWEAFCRGYGDWLVAHQNSDGSWYRAYNWDNSVSNSGKFNTTNPIKFLVQLASFTGDARYLDAAKRAGAWAFDNIHLASAYVGGTPDNPNTIDKEAVECPPKTGRREVETKARHSNADLSVWKARRRHETEAVHGRADY